MGLLDAARAVMGIKTKNNNSTGTAGLDSILGMGGSGIGAIAGAIGGSSNKPVATDHTHDSDSRNQARTDALTARNNSGPRGGDSRFDLGDKNDSFMGAKQQSDFANLTNPKAELDRGGRIISSPEGLDNVGIEPAMNPPFAVPIQNNQSEELEGLYS